MNARASSSYRLPALLLFAVFAIGMVGLDRSGSERSIPTVRVRSVVDGPTVPRADAVSVAWYCTEGTTATDSRAEETVLIANLSKDPLEATITVMHGPDEDPVVERRTVEALGQERVPVADLVDAEEPGVVVEFQGGPAIVEHEVRNGDKIAVGPCAREPSRDWFFAAGTTQRGAQEWLTLFNPFGEDAIVNVSFLTTSGFDAPGSTQGIAVSRRSRISIPVHEEVQREDAVAISVHARVGRVVAERTLLFDGSEEVEGIAVSGGATGGESRWVMPLGLAQEGIGQTVAIANFARRPARVEVAWVMDSDATVEPRTIDVPARSVSRVQVSDRVIEGTLYGIEARVIRGPDVVVEARTAWVAPAAVADVASTTAASTRATSWAFSAAQLDDASDAYLIAANVSDRPLTVQLYAYTAGDPDSPSSAPARAVAPGELAIFRMSEIGVRPDQVLVVSADGPIVAGRLSAGGGLSFSIGVPDVST